MVVDVAVVVEAARFCPLISIFVASSCVNICNEERVNFANALLNIVSCEILLIVTVDCL